MSENNPPVVVVNSSTNQSTGPTVSPSATPVYAVEVERSTPGNVGYAIPVYAQSVQPVSDSRQYSHDIFYASTIPMPGDPRITVTIDQHQIPENIATVYSLSRSLKCLTIVDIITIIIGSIFNLFWLFFIWGPIAGFYGALKYRLYFVYCYAIYWMLRIFVDLLYILTGYWWHIVLLILDLYILRYVRIHILALKSLNYDHLELLRQLNNPRQDDNNYFSYNP